MSNDSKKTSAIGTPALLGILLLILAIVGAWPFIAYNKEFRRCVQLKNGLNLGYNAVFDLREPYWLPEEVPKFPDGTPLVEGDVWPIYVTDSTLYGIALSETGSEDFEFAWRADTGLVLKNENQQKYEKLVSEAGDTNPGINIGLIGSGWLLKELMKRPEYADQWCATRFITW